MHIQSVLIPKRTFTLVQAKAWIKKHGYKLTYHGKEVDITEKFYRFRQKAPKKDMRYFVRHIEQGILYVMMY